MKDRFLSRWPIFNWRIAYAALEATERVWACQKPYRLTCSLGFLSWEWVAMTLFELCWEKPTFVKLVASSGVVDSKTWMKHKTILFYSEVTCSFVIACLLVCFFSIIINFLVVLYLVLLPLLFFCIWFFGYRRHKIIAQRNSFSWFFFLLQKFWNICNVVRYANVGTPRLLASVSENIICFEFLLILSSHMIMFVFVNMLSQR